MGIVAKLLPPGRDPGGFVVTILLGIIGALLGAYLGRAMGWYWEGEPAGFIVAGAITYMRDSLVVPSHRLGERSLGRATVRPHGTGPG